jgi:hypothetical protein
MGTRHSIITIIFLIYGSISLKAQEKSTRFNGFGHSEYTLVNKDSIDSYFSLGEHDFFVTSNLSKRISFLGEYVFRFNTKSATSFLPSIERSFVKFNYYKGHSIIGGKIHSPVNYWNDVYHHGRVFFPVIDRPFAFSYMIPLHTLGLQVQGQNLGKLGFGYDFVFGNGISSSDAFQGAFSPSYTAAVHIKPIDGMRLGISHYYNRLDQNTSGAHIGHLITPGNTGAPNYKGPVDFNLSCVSMAWFGKRFEFLNEYAYNTSRTDSLGEAYNFSNFTYLGYRINEKSIPFILVDYLRIADNDLHVFKNEQLKLAVGYRHEINYLVNVKIQAEHIWSQHENHLIDNHLGSLGLRVQLAYGF